METNTSPHVVISDMVDGGVYIEFADGKNAIYSSRLFYGMLHQAEQIDDIE